MGVFKLTSRFHSKFIYFILISFQVCVCGGGFRTLYLSFGGLLMSLAADKHVVGDLELDMRVYLLVKRSPESLVE